MSVYVSGPGHSVSPGTTFHGQRRDLGCKNVTLRSHIICPDVYILQGLPPGSAPVWPIPVESPVARQSWEGQSSEESSSGVHPPRGTISKSKSHHVAKVNTQLKLFLINSLFLLGACAPIVGSPAWGSQWAECLVSSPGEALVQGNP